MIRALPLAWVAALAVATAVPSHADEWVKTYDFAGRPDIRVIADDARVQVRTWDQPGAEVRVTTVGWDIGGRGVKVLERRDGDDLVLEVREPRRMIVVGRHSIEVTLSVPASADLDVSTGDGPVSVGAVRGRIRVHTGDGSIVVNGVGGAITLTTGDGRISGRDIEGSLEARTGDGSIDVSGRFDLLDLNTGDGRIAASATEGSRVREPWSLTTGDGGLALQVPSTLAADLDARAGDGGVNLGIPVQVSGKLDRSTVRGAMNGGGLPLTLRTGSGSIRIEAL